MANYDDFIYMYNEQFNKAINYRDLLGLLNIWNEFLDKCAFKADSKLNEFDDMFC